MNKKSKNNLKKPSHDQAVERGRIGGKKSAEARNKRKAIKEYLEIALTHTPENESELELMRAYGIKENDMTEAMLITLSVLDKAKAGDMRAVEFIRDTIGEKPEINLNANANITEHESKVVVYLPDNGRGDLEPA